MAVLKHEIKSQLEAWLLGIYSEIEFWNNYHIKIVRGRTFRHWRGSFDLPIRPSLPTGLITRCGFFVTHGNLSPRAYARTTFTLRSAVTS